MFFSLFSFFGAAASKSNSSSSSFKRKKNAKGLNFSLLDTLKCIPGLFSSLTEGSADAIAFAVNKPSHLCQITVSPGDVINSGGLCNECIV